MDNRNKQVKSIFSEAYKKRTVRERMEYLDSKCGNDSDLRAEVESLLRAHDDSAGFLDAPILDSSVTLEYSALSEGPGTVIGRYKLLEKIGEGGMAVVYMAEQAEPIRRRVALKIIKLGMDTKSVIARFEAERQALAMMDHPNIAKVLDAGATETGRPYFVMDLVPGLPITKYCDKNRLSIEERLTLFIAVCSAVQHAHQKGIIHRDVKPSNIIVTMHDGEPVPKVIDFGIAKATNQRLTEKTLFTRHAQIIGTPAYMSPEQAELTDWDVDTRTDIYSLGILLYELLTGTTPFDEQQLREAGYLKMQKIICQEEPTKPSTKLSTLGEALTDIAKWHNCTPELMPKLVRGDLDWIVMKALEKNRTRRYDTANALAADVQRHLNNEPVEAAAPSIPYKLRKFVRRHRVFGAAVAAISVALFVVVALSVMYARERAVHASEAEKARQEITDLLAGSYVDQAQSLCEQGHIGRGMLWLAHSLEMAPEGSGELKRAIRVSLAAWRDQLHSLTNVVRYPNKISQVTFTPDGERIFVACQDGTARLCDGTTGQPIGKPLRHGSEVLAVAVSPDGTRIATGGSDGYIRLWDAVTLTPIGEPIQYEWESADECFMAFSLDSSRLIAACGDGVVRLWGANTSRPLGKDTQTISLAGDFWMDGARLYEGDYVAPDGNFSSPGNTAVNMLTNGGFETGAVEPWYTFGHITTEIVGGLADATVPEAVIEGDSCLHVVVPKADIDYWRIGLQHKEHVFEAGKKYTLSVFLKSKKGKLNINIKPEIAIPPWTSFGNEIVSATEKWAEYTITTPVLSEDVGPVNITFNCVSEKKYDVRAVAYCPGGPRAVVRSKRYDYQMLDVDSGEPIGPPVSLGRTAFAVAISPDGRQFVTGDGGGTIRVWDAATGEQVGESISHGGVTYALAYSPDGSRIVSGGASRMARLWDATTGAPIGGPMRQRNTVTTVAFSPDGAAIVTGNDGGVIQGWDLVRDRHVGKTVQSEGRICGARFGHYGLWVLTQIDEKVQFRNVTTGEPIGKPFSGPEQTRLKALSPDCSLLVTQRAPGARELPLWNVATGQMVGELHHREPHCVVFSPDGTRILTGGEDNIARLWDTATSECFAEFHQFEGVVSDAAFSPDGSKFLIGSYDGTTRIWDAKTLKLTGEPLIHQSEVKGLAYSPDGKKILIGFADGTVRLYDAAKLKPIGTPLQHVELVCSVDYSPDGSQLLACSIDGTARLWDAATLKPIGPPLEHDCGWPYASFSPDGSQILLYDKNTLQVWQTPPAPLAGDCGRIACWVQVITGMELDSTGGINVLDAAEWKKRRRYLQEMGGPPELTFSKI